jgi:DNA-binding winged helix-turn-helix (wHTH) protein
MGDFLFGRFRLIPDRRALLLDGREIAVRSRPFDILLTLVEERDRVVSKEKLLQQVFCWDFAADAGKRTACSIRPSPSSRCAALMTRSVR